MAEAWLSYDARTIADRLEALGISFESESYYALECAVLAFFPNHIAGVVEGCFKNGDRAGKLARAQEQGWDYFARPIQQLLAKRPAAHRYKPLREVPEEARQVWRVCQARLLLRDMDQGEAEALLRGIPLLLRLQQITMQDIRAGIQVCRERNARTPRYLYGILRKLAAEKVGRTRERRAAKPEPAPAPELPALDPETIARVRAGWDRRQYGIEVLRDLRRYADGTGLGQGI